MVLRAKEYVHRACLGTVHGTSDEQYALPASTIDKNEFGKLIQEFCARMILEKANKARAILLLSVSFCWIFDKYTASECQCIHLSWRYSQISFLQAALSL